MSFTGMMVLVAGILLALPLYISKIGGFKSLLNKRAAAFISGIVLIIGLLFAFAPDSLKNHLSERGKSFSTEGFADKLEVFDAAGVNFLNHNPKYYLAGTGPGLIYLPASEYMVARDVPIWGHKFEALPHMGLVLTICNAGVIGLLILLFGFFSAFKSQSNRTANRVMVGVMLTGIYFMQIRYYFIFGFAFLLAQSTTIDREEINAKSH
jgi:hypothetical protein